MLEAKKKPRVLVAMSGGVDSSVAAAILKDQGYDVVGATMQVWDYSKNLSCDMEEGLGTCCSSIDVDDARAVCDQLEIPFYVINCEEEFKAKVIDPFINSYLEGTTPIPCSNCNTFLKFDHLVKKMHELECDYIATGHYAQVEEGEDGKHFIVTSTDDWKDQTYFLFNIDENIIPKLLFPVGDFKKPKIRDLAEKYNLDVARKKDSTGICFVGKRSYVDFVEEHTTKKDYITGSIKLYPEGDTLAQHEGIHRFTVGQRKGLGISFSEPLFVKEINKFTGEVWLCRQSDLFKNSMLVKDMTLFTELEKDKIYNVKIRFAHQGAQAKIVKSEDGYIFNFESPQKAIAPGQAAVIYEGQKLLGGGWIQ